MKIAQRIQTILAGWRARGNEGMAILGQCYVADS